jgi:hypothetical protein
MRNTSKNIDKTKENILEITSIKSEGWWSGLSGRAQQEALSSNPSNSEKKKGGIFTNI